MGYTQTSGVWGGGGSLITYPTNDIAPATIEPTIHSIVGSTTNPFTGSQATYNWGVQFPIYSIELPPMTIADAVEFQTFFLALTGMVNVFEFPSTVIDSTYDYSGFLKVDDVPFIWRLAQNDVKGKIDNNYFIWDVFVIRQAL